MLNSADQTDVSRPHALMVCAAYGEVHTAERETA
jgi:hypothetical protein